MRRSGLLSFVLAASTHVLAGFIAPVSLDQLPKPNEVPGGFIVELSTAPQARGIDVHDEFLSELDRRASGKFVTTKKYASPIFNGLAVKLKNPEDLVSLTDIPHVVSVRPIVIHPLPKTLDHKVVSKPTDPAVYPDGQSTHIMTGVDKAHAAGITGKGIRIAVIDTGIDYTHPNLGGGFGAGFKVAGGYDLVGDDYTGRNDPVPDSDPQDTCVGHGTHVAGIIGANPGNLYNISGVAYEAELYAYRVFGCFGGSGDDVLLDAMIRAVKDGADVISMSIGIADGWSTTALALGASNAVNLGKVVTIAVGNDGEAGTMFSSSPASGVGVIAVGSVQNTKFPYAYITTSQSDAKIPYTTTTWPVVPGSPVPVGDTPFPLYALSTDPNAVDLGCQPFGDDVPDLSKYAVLVRANFSGGECDYLTQADNLEAKNAQLVLYYDVNDPNLWPLFGFFESVTLNSHSDALELLAELAKDPSLTVKFSQTTDTDTGTVELPADDGGLPSYFSSFGPSNDMYFKPTISAPGGNITSTWPVAAGSWAIDSGTSMATPFLAGSAALVLQAKGKGVAKDVRNILQSTSSSLPVSKEKNALPETLAHQGAGLVNVFSAISSNTQVSPAELLTNDTAHWKGRHTFTIHNGGKKAQTYTLSHQAAGTTVTIPHGDVNFNVYPVPLVNAPATVTLSAKRLVVAPGRSATVTVNIQPPKNADPKSLPVLSGWIHVVGSLGDRVKVSYMGVGGSFKAAQAISTGNRFFVEGGIPAVIPLDPGILKAQTGLRNYTIGADNWPAFIIGFSTPTRRVVYDLVPANTTLKSTIPDPRASGLQKRRWSWWWPGIFNPKPTDSFSKVPTLGRLAEYLDQDRAGLSSQSDVPLIIDLFPDHFANGTAIPVGEYRMLVRVLRLGGNAREQADYDVHVSEPVGFLPAAA